MPTAIDICNGAFDLLGTRTISSLSDDNKEARLASRIYDGTRDEMLRAHPWNFAQLRASLAADATPPAWGFANRYPLPADCLRLLALSEADFHAWRVEARWLLTDIGSPVDVLYITSAADPSTYDPMFVSVLEAALAAKMAYPITGSREMARELTQLTQMRLAATRSMDAIEHGFEVVNAPTFLEARL